MSFSVINRLLKQFLEHGRGLIFVNQQLAKHNMSPEILKTQGESVVAINALSLL